MSLDSHLFVAWRQPAERRTFPVARLLRLADGRYEFAYVEGARAAANFGFIPFTFAPRLETVYASDDLPPFFANRLMGERRPDYPEWLSSMGLPTEAQPFEIFARSAGVRATDDFELYVPSRRNAAGDFEYRFFARGVGFIAEVEARIAQLQPGDLLDFRREDDNPVDQFAVSVHDHADAKVGYIPYILTEDLRAMLAGGSQLELRVERVNPRPTSLQHRLLIRMTVGACDGVEPFGGERHRPISAEAAVVSTVSMR